jgi:hypothetical protein
MESTEQDPMEGSQKLAVVRLHNGELGEDIVEVEEIADDERIIGTQAVPTQVDRLPTVTPAPGTLPLQRPGAKDQQDT